MDARHEWTTTLPAAPGWYWWRRTPDAEPGCVEVFASAGGPPLVVDPNGPRWPVVVLSGEWCGPLAPPA